MLAKTRCSLRSDGQCHAGVADDARRPGIARRRPRPCRRRAKRSSARAGWSTACSSRPTTVETHRRSQQGDIARRWTGGAARGRCWRSRRAACCSWVASCERAGRRCARSARRRTPSSDANPPSSLPPAAAVTNYPHPIIAREGWPFLAIALVVAVALSVHGLVAAGGAGVARGSVHRCSSSAIRRARFRPTPKAVLSPADGKIVVVEKARDPYLDRDALKISVFMNVFNVHSNRSPVDGEVVERAGTTPAASSTPRSTRRRSRTSATRCTCARRRARRDLRADRRPRSRGASSATSKPGDNARARPALRLHPLRLARRRLPAARREAARRGRRQVSATETILADLAPDASASLSGNGLAATLRRHGRRLSDPPRRAEEPHPSPRHLPAAEPVHDRGAVRRLLRDRAGDEPQLRPGGDRHLRRDGARQPRRPRRAPDQDAERVRRRVRQPRPTWCRFGAAPALVMYEWVLRDLGKLGWIAAFVYCAGAALRLARFNTHARRRRQALVHRALPSPSRRPRWSRASSGSSTTRLRPRAAALVGAGRHGVRRTHDGEQPQVLELQDDQPARRACRSW